MEYILNAQFSMFGDFKNFDASMELINRISKACPIQNYLPSTVINQNINLPSNTVTEEQRISFIDKANGYSFVINSDRIDFTYEKITLSNFSEDIISSFFNEVKAISAPLFRELNVSSNRLAFNLHLLSEVISKTDITRLFHDKLKGLDFYDDKEMIEWNNVMNCKMKWNEENLNIITTLTPAKNVQNNEQRVLAHFDLNTFADNTILRFNGESINEFAEKVDKIYKELVKSYVKFLNS